MVAFHFPPCAGTSGVHRTLKFARYLPECGWAPVVLTAHPSAHHTVAAGRVDLPAGLVVARARALDAARHLAIAGRYPRFSALPDRWATWWLGAVPTGLRLIRRFKPAALWSTYPIATAHLIALTLHRLTGIPWVADFRDPMTEDGYPSNRTLWRTLRWVERQTIGHADRIVFTAPSARTLYQERYPRTSADTLVTIPNGYDEEDFVGLSPTHRLPEGRARPLRLVHAGVIYRDERDPRSFFTALAQLKRAGAIDRHALRVDLRATSADAHFAAILRQLDIDDIVHLLSPLPHRRALEDCADADALLLFQGASCNRQIPAKAYEYLRLARPILALTHEAGDTADLLRRTGGATIVSADDPVAIRSRLLNFLAAVRLGSHPPGDPDTVTQFMRRRQTAVLARCLADVVQRA
ncbi:MAG: glycosyltransferase [Candidatus Rokuibacteriota bacterium]